jgi:hypothetical protein
MWGGFSAQLPPLGVVLPYVGSLRSGAAFRCYRLTGAALSIFSIC